MKKHIALLRGINVSGQKLIKMEVLRKAMQELGLQDVSTYIQSGNILFQSDETNPKVLEHKISGKIMEAFGFDVSVIVVTPEDLETAVRENPFAAKTTDDSTQPYIGFLSESPLAENHEILKATDFKGDEFAIIGKRIYLWYADSAANTKLNNAVIERKLKVVSTARNWKTVRKLIELSKA
ncbi:DUF1697 domain-containing protein [Flavobacterium sp. MAH-1]|uniref:DUF1697 domain-containing protein n=1 Tax=Flavobacterium agri TaxID=2743471 RepID=A0A7Y8XZY9_9FLAO|nr:DUF1697 domain-containing protein [Flavobacterium agri]NUY80019.1 DUF1697 domain-containing protein [Flavobacterium agri]NYA70044.1 DUF1697 domain-containing protein [Flavobacterium agri]